MKKAKRIFALAGAILLAALFITAIILAATGAPVNYLMAVIFSLFFIPIIMYAMGLMSRVVRPSGDEELETFIKEDDKAQKGREDAAECSDDWSDTDKFR